LGVTLSTYSAIVNLESRKTRVVSKLNEIKNEAMALAAELVGMLHNNVINSRLIWKIGEIRKRLLQRCQTLTSNFFCCKKARLGTDATEM